MPSPFNNPEQQVSEPEYVSITQSALTCEFCFRDSDHGTYSPKHNTLWWTCECGQENIVKNIRL